MKKRVVVFGLVFLLSFAVACASQSAPAAPTPTPAVTIIVITATPAVPATPTPDPCAEKIGQDLALCRAKNRPQDAPKSQFYVAPRPFPTREPLPDLRDLLPHSPNDPVAIANALTKCSQITDAAARDACIYAVQGVKSPQQLEAETAQAGIQANAMMVGSVVLALAVVIAAVLLRKRP